MALNPSQIEWVENTGRYYEISNRQRSTAVSAAVLVFAGMTLILTENPSRFVTQVEIFSVALGLLLVAVFTHDITYTRKIMLTLQEASLEYGMLFMALGIHALVTELVPTASLVTLIVFWATFSIRLYGAYGELQSHRNEFRTTNSLNRREYLQERFER